MIYVNNNICIENNQFSLKMVKFEDAKDLLKVYSDLKALQLFNSDNCHDDFHYETVQRMKEAISFWLENSKNKHFIRLCIIDKKINVAIGTIELFQRRSEDYYNGKAIMRLDLRNDYEKSEYIKIILLLIIPHIYIICHSDFVAIKIPVFAKERLKAIEDLDFKSEEEYLIGTDGTQYGYYYTKKVNHNI